jgi:hypothetical protein
VFQPDEGADAGEHVLLDVQADQIDRLEYKADKRQVVAEALPKGGYRLTIQQTLSKRVAKKKPPKPTPVPADGGIDGGAAEEAPPAKPAEPEVREETKVTRYRASADFEKALARVLPLVAVRDLGEVDAEQLKKFGLAEPKAELAITSRGQTVRFQIGERTYGRASVYVRPASGGSTSLVSAGVLGAVDFRPPRFKELRFLGLKSKQVEQLVLDCDATGSRTLVHRDRLKPGGGSFQPADDLEVEDDLYRNWVGKLLRLSLVEYLEGPLEPTPGAHCKLTFQSEGGQPLLAEITWLTEPSGKQVYYGRSDFTGDWVRLEPTAAGSLVADLSSVLGQAADKAPSISP